jgi:biopolymer transport protein ExbD
MALSVGRPRGGAIAEINVTPMADVMIVLLIIFMVTAPIIAGAPVRLPAAVHSSEHKGDTLTVTVHADGGVAIDGTSFPDTVPLDDYLAARASATRSLLILVQADREASYRDIERVLTACRTYGVAEIALAAELKPGI